MKQAFLVLILFIFCVAAPAQNAEVVNFVAPEKYPLAAMAVRATGEVAVDVQIDPSGNVISARAVSGHPLLRGASEKAAMKWQFSKAFAESKPAIQLIFDYRPGGMKAIESSEKKTDTAVRSNHPSPFRLEVIGDTLIPKLLLLERENGEIPSEICEVHKQIMQVEIQDVIYDESEENEEDFLEVKEEFFPNANVRIYGDDNNEIRIKRKEIHFCHMCRFKLQEWLQKNR